MSEIIVPPPGMPYPLARTLIGDGAFAHKWLCHNGGECPDGCDQGADPKRAEMYDNIRCYFTDREVRAYRRGYEDAAREKPRPRLFRKVGAHLVADCGDDDHMSDNWDDDMRQAYMDGYDAGEEATIR